MKTLGRLEKNKNYWFLLIVSFIFFLLRFPSLFEPYWYGDEGIYQTIGMAMQKGLLLYRDIWDNKPPLLYALYSLFDSDQFLLRLISLIFGLLSVIVFFFLAKNLFTKEENKLKTPKIAYITTSIFAVLFGLPLLEGNIANAENFMTLPILLSGLLVFKVTTDKKYSKQNPIIIFGVGILLSIAFLFKIVAVFDTAAFFLFLVFIEIKEKKHLQTFISNLLYFIIGFFTPVILVSLFFLLNGAFYDFISASFLQNVGYVGYGNKYIFPQGLLFVKLVFLGFFVLFLFKKIKTVSASSLFIFLWFSFSLFNAFFAQRPYTHYLLVILPSLLFVFGLIFDKRYQKFAMVIFILSIILLAKNFNVYGKTPFYYQNFISFITGNKDVPSYYAFFDYQTLTDYELAQFIKGHANNKENLFIWGNNAQLYKLVDKLPPGRYTVAYHMTYSKKSLEETKQAFYKNNPKYVIVTSARNPIPYSLSEYFRRANIRQAVVYENSFK